LILLLSPTTQICILRMVRTDTVEATVLKLTAEADPILLCPILEVGATKSMSTTAVQHPVSVVVHHGHHLLNVFSFV
jgi:hypothetical protein